MEIVLSLKKEARAKGGDRYEAIIENEQNPLVIYLPQTITRKNNRACKEISININPKFEN